MLTAELVAHLVAQLVAHLRPAHAHARIDRFATSQIRWIAARARPARFVAGHIENGPQDHSV